MIKFPINPALQTRKEVPAHQPKKSGTSPMFMAKTMDLAHRPCLWPKMDLAHRPCLWPDGQFYHYVQQAKAFQIKWLIQFQNVHVT
jgi:hypothetical protein